MAIGKLVKRVTVVFINVLCDYCRNITFRDLCAAGRLEIPQIPELTRIALAAVPCVLLSPLDCYWEGSILQEPDAFVAPVNIPSCLQNSPHGNDSIGVTWGNLDFGVLQECLLDNASISGITPFLDLVCF